MVFKFRIIEYIGSSLSSNSRLFSLQKTALRLMTFSNPLSHSKPLFAALDIAEIKELLFISNILLIFKTLNGLAPINISSTLDLCYASHSYATRISTLKFLQRPEVRTSHYGLNSIRYQSIICWNSLQSSQPRLDIRAVSYTKIKALSKFCLQFKS